MNGSHPRGPLRAVLTGLFVLLTCSGALQPLRAQSPDPSAPGPYAVTKEEYTLGDRFAHDVPPASEASPYTKLTGFPGPVEFTGSVHYPSTATDSGTPVLSASGRPFPLIVFLHGRHSSAYNPTTGSARAQWPPVAPNVSVPSYEGYDYIARTLASDGYIVVSISANGINAQDANTSDAGALARAQLIQAHLDYWAQLSTVGASPFVNKFVGFVDMTNIGTMGHSRGGEGVMAHAVFNADPVKNPEAATGPAYPIKAVLPLAPIDFNRYVVNNIPFAVILPYCDGDVSDLQGMHFFDDARYSVPTDPTPKYFWTIMGADHNLSNTVWTPGLFPTLGAAYAFGGTADDWLATPGGALDPYAGPTVPGNHRLSPAAQQAVVRNYTIAFFRTYIGGETQFLPFLRGEALPPSEPTGELFETYLAPPTARLDLNRFLDSSSLSTNTVGGAVLQSGLSPFAVVGGVDNVPALRPLPNQPSARQPANTPSNFAPTKPGLSQLSLGWSKPGAVLENDLPDGLGNVSGYAVLQFRAAVNFTDPRNRVLQDDFSVVLTDSMGRSAATPVSRWSQALMYPPGKLVRIPKVVLNAIRIPLSAFVGVDRTQITSVKFVFDRQTQGALLLTDIAFMDPATMQVGARPAPARRIRLTAAARKTGKQTRTARLVRL